MSSCWRRLLELAEHVHPQRKEDLPFPDRLPPVSAYAMDDIKDDVCRLRAGGWSSVDAVTIGVDGRIYFMEFKDESKNQAAVLRKKAFDSLALFKIRFAPTLSFDDICARAVFALVRPDAPEGVAPSLDLDRMFQEDSKTQHPLALDYQLDGLRKLYADVRILSSSSLQNLLLQCSPAADENEFDHRLRLLQTSPSLTRRPSQMPSHADVRPLGQLLQVSRGRPIACAGDWPAIDFRSAAKSLLELRMMRPYEQFCHARDRWFVCEAYCETARELCAYQDVGASATYPLATLVNTAFDSAILADWIFGVRCSYTLRYGGGSGLSFPRPDRSAAPFVSKFWENYHEWFDRGSFGLKAFSHIGWYSSVRVVKVDDSSERSQPRGISSR